LKRLKQNTAKKQTDSPLGSRKQWVFMLCFAAIAVVSVWAVASQSRSFSLADFGEYIQQASLPWLLVAVASMLGFIFFEAYALLVLCRALGHKKTLWQGYIYSASDIYFSAITPSATGGQPASAYFMMKDGISGTCATPILIANLCMYTLSLILVSTITFVLRFDMFLRFSFPSQALIVAGYVVQIGLLIFFYMVLTHAPMLHRMCSAVLRVLCKLRILKNYPAKQAKLDGYVKRYHNQTKVIKEHPKAVWLCFLFNFLQRVCQVAVTLFVYVATSGKSFFESIDLFFWQSYAVIGSNAIPVPGAMGISDYLMLDGFQNIMSEAQAVNLELLSRSLSFYSCVIICGISILIQYCWVKKRGKTE